MPVDGHPVPATERVIEQRLAECGLDKAGFTVKYERDLQSIHIVIKPKAGATRQQFDCIRKAVGVEIVTFQDGAMQMAYFDYLSELGRPLALQSAKAELEEQGLLAGFPERGNFDNGAAYAEALERHCNLEPGSALKAIGGDIMFQPNAAEVADFEAFSKKYSCLFLAMKYAGAAEREVKFGFIGNEAFSEEGQ